MIEMNDSLSLLQLEYKQIRRNILCFVLLLLLCCACLFWNKAIALLLLGVAVLVHWFVLRKKQKRYAEHVTEQNLLQTICKQLDAPPPSRDTGGTLTRERLMFAKLMPIDQEAHACLLRQGISGIYAEMQIELCDITVAQTFRLSTKGRRRIHYNAGAWIHISLPQDSGQNWRVLDETSVPTPIRMQYFSTQLAMESAVLSEPELCKKMVLYRPIEQAEQQPSAAALSHLKKLVNYTTGYVAVSLQGDALDIFLRGRFLSRPVSMQKPPSPDLLRFDPLPELQYCIRLAKVLLH